MRGLLAFFLALGFWVLLVWPPDWQELSVGSIAAVIAAILFGGMLRVQEFRKMLNPLRYLWGLYYILILIYHIIAANLDVAYRVLHPEMPIKPGIVKVRTALKNEIAKTILANSITLTPGTLSVDLSDGEDGHFYIHWINVRAEEIEGATRYIVRRFEPILRRIFE
ncbi:TPA: hypothetical protein EYP12_04975 [Candidatus Bipolaricaulota bacterium]|nr:hypothetical protein [Candidatus Bipolaricaulota bacterium]